MLKRLMITIWCFCAVQWNTNNTCICHRILCLRPISQCSQVYWEAFTSNNLDNTGIKYVFFSFLDIFQLYGILWNWSEECPAV